MQLNFAEFFTSNKGPHLKVHQAFYLSSSKTPEENVFSPWLHWDAIELCRIFSGEQGPPFSKYANQMDWPCVKPGRKCFFTLVALRCNWTLQIFLRLIRAPAWKYAKRFVYPCVKPQKKMFFSPCLHWDETELCRIFSVNKAPFSSYANQMDWPRVKPRKKMFFSLVCIEMKLNFAEFFQWTRAPFFKLRKSKGLTSCKTPEENVFFPLFALRCNWTLQIFYV